MATAPLTSGTPAQHLLARKNDDQVSFAPKQKLAQLQAEPESEPTTSPINADQPKAVVNTSGQVTGTTINTSA